MGDAGSTSSKASSMAKLPMLQAAQEVGAIITTVMALRVTHMEVSKKRVRVKVAAIITSHNIMCGAAVGQATPRHCLSERFQGEEGVAFNNLARV